MSHAQPKEPFVSPELPQRYLDLLKKTLTMALWEARDGTQVFNPRRGLRGKVRTILKNNATFREQHGIDEPIETIDWTGVWWRRKS